VGRAATELTARLLRVPLQAARPRAGPARAPRRVGRQRPVVREAAARPSRELRRDLTVSSGPEGVRPPQYKHKFNRPAHLMAVNRIRVWASSD